MVVGEPWIFIVRSQGPPMLLGSQTRQTRVQGGVGLHDKTGTWGGSGVGELLEGLLQGLADDSQLTDLAIQSLVMFSLPPIHAGEDLLTALVK
eukprot:CAMPEP_0175987198 /NCGR_PEP_ID=MMETSP0108-20121206/50575_1 /TAXON_ID=195067 ORGANISM="Goniomonas pacifica, Strain CCMP1869" /NCGR_SAMPLE_ID=MMETSP0108 /ASSEMBLY_ACC=CAM_ASM_000204 /LENGTH=92 /DNA_ID=CAMNT_0017318447 /DNA_START=56 /DNA_END=334 /DNA_ORIENTATION=+